MNPLQGTVSKDSMTIAGKLIADMSSAKFLYASTSSNNSTPRQGTSSSGYTSATGFRVYGMLIKATSTTVADCTVGYADNDVGMGTATAFTNRVFLGASSLVTWDNVANTNQQPTEWPIQFDVPANKYLAVNSGAGGCSWLFVIKDL